MAMNKVTQQEIAAALGLSRNTVSKVFNESDAIAAKTRKAVIKTAMEMGYKHIGNDFYKELSDSSPKVTETVAFVCRRNDIHGYWSKIINGLENAVSKNGMSLVLCMVDPEQEETCELPATLRNMAHKGIVTTGIFISEYYHKINSLGIPWVSIDTAYDISSLNLLCDTIMCNNIETIEQIVKTLAAQGHTKIGYIGDAFLSRAYMERWMGFQQAMNGLGLPIDHQCCLAEAGCYHYVDGEELRSLLRNLTDKVTAIVCSSDSVALPITHCLSNIGLSVPNDIAISGFDDLDEGVRASLTTVKNFPEDTGKCAGETLFWRMQNVERPLQTVQIQAEIIYRNSTNKTI